MPAAPVFMPGSIATMFPLGRQRIAALSTTPEAIPLPAGVALRRILRTLIRSTQDIVYTDTSPTSVDGNDGFYIKADEVFVYDGDPSALFVRTATSATGTADVRLAYYGT